ncbi:MAG: hypothetical protein EZS28_011393 [Streblomastix strix]|uniref:Uncharacterized protein n=1 Tax=Streblomastix strix TaxID=222440 RepID=A0A5J4WF91_9EUKA|nr:MAG: hypothetical protein EZS28_011393 [Streblomastix strix]
MDTFASSSQIKQILGSRCEITSYISLLVNNSYYLYYETVKRNNGPVQQKIIKNSYTDELKSPNFSQHSRDVPDKDPRTQRSSSNDDAPSVFPFQIKDLNPMSQKGTRLSLGHNYETFTKIEEDFLEEKGCEVYVGEQTGEYQVRFRGQIKATVKVHELYVKSERIQDTTRASQAKMRTFRDSEPETPISIETQQILQYAKFNSIEDQKVAQDLTSTLEGILKQQAVKLDVLNYWIQSIARQRLFDEIAWSGDNTIFPKPEASPTLPDEGLGYARMTLESTSAVTQGLASIIHQIAAGETYEVVGKIFKVFKASLLSVCDQQRERQSKIRGFQSDITTEDISS